MSSIIIIIIVCYTLYKIIAVHSSIDPKKVNKAIVEVLILASDKIIDEIHMNYLKFKNNNPEFKHIDFETYLLNFKIKNQNEAKQFLENLSKKTDNK